MLDAPPVPAETLAALDAFLTEWQHHGYEKLIKMAPAALAGHDLGCYFPPSDRLETRRRWLALHVWHSTASYNAVRIRQLSEENLSFFIYRHGATDGCPHAEWNGFAAPPDHPIWATHMPANGWHCRCWVTGARTRNGIIGLGGDPDKPLPDGWDTIDPKTGTPPGIEPGFDTRVFPDLATCLRALHEGRHHLDG